MRVALPLLAAALAACSSTTSSGSGTGDGGSSATQTTCYDAAGKPTQSCALTPAASVCSMGDANACVPLTKIEVYADDGHTGVCLHLVFTNQCSSEIFADACIEHTDPNLAGLHEQCWTSSTMPGYAIDVSQCHATGKYFFVSTTSSGQLDILEQKCPAPKPG